MANRATQESQQPPMEGMKESEKMAPKQKREIRKPAEAIVIDETDVGDLDEFRVGADRTEKAVVVGKSEEGTVLSLESKLHVVTNPKEQKAYEISTADEQVMKLSLLKAVDNYCQAVGLSADETREIKQVLKNKSEEIFLRATLADNQDEAIVSSVTKFVDFYLKKTQGEREERTAKKQFAIEAGEKVKEIKAQDQLVVSLSEATQEFAHAKIQADEAYKANNEKAYQDAVDRCNAAQNLISKLRLQLKPEATPEQQTVVKEEAKGAVVPEPDALYDEGFEAVKNRLKELEQTMKDADKAKDETAWTVANDEYSRHRVMMPILEQADLLERIDKTVEFAIQNATQREEQKLAFKKEVSQDKVREKESYWRNIGVGLKKMQQKLDNLSNAYDFLVGSGQMTEEKYKQYKNAHEKAVTDLKQQLTSEELQLKDLVAANSILEKRGLEMAFDQRIEDRLEEQRGQTTTLTNKLRDAYAENPDRVMSSVKKLLKSKTIRDTTRAILQKFVDHPVMEEKLPEPDVDSAINAAFIESGKPTAEPIPTETSIERSAWEDDIEPETPGMSDSEQVRDAFRLPEPGEGMPGWEVSQGKFEAFLHAVEINDPIAIKIDGKMQRGWKLKAVDTLTSKLTLERKEGTEYVQIFPKLTQEILDLNGLNEPESSDSLPEEAPNSFVRPARMENRPRGDQEFVNTGIIRVAEQPQEVPPQASQPSAPEPKKSLWGKFKGLFS